MNDRHTITFDIETEGLPESELLAIMPDFKPNGTLKDPDKIAADLAKKKAEWIEKAALSPLTGRVLCIGANKGGSFILFDGGGIVHAQIVGRMGERGNIKENYNFISFPTGHSFRHHLHSSCKRAMKLGVKPMVRFDWGLPAAKTPSLTSNTCGTRTHRASTPRFFRYGSP